MPTAAATDSTDQQQEQMMQADMTALDDARRRRNTTHPADGMRADLARLAAGIEDTIRNGVRPEKVRRRQATAEQRNDRRDYSPTPMGRTRSSGPSNPVLNAVVGWEARVQDAVTTLGEVSAVAGIAAAWCELDIDTPEPPPTHVRDTERRVMEAGMDGEPTTVTVLRPVIDIAPTQARRWAAAAAAHVAAVITALEDTDPRWIASAGRSQVADLAHELRRAAARHGLTVTPAAVNRRCADPVDRGCDRVVRGCRVCGACREAGRRARVA